MKTLKYVLFAIIFLTFSCSKDGYLSSDEDLNQLSVNNSLKTSRHIIEVYPDFPFDTQNLIDAFSHAQVRGATVKLMPGIFKIDMIEIKEFYGSFMGSGKGITILTNIPDLNPDAAIIQNKLPACLNPPNNWT
jgi:hypothetical protein